MAARKKKTPGEERARGARRSGAKIARDPTSDAALLSLDPEMARAPDMPVEVAVREVASLARLARSLGKEMGKIGLGAEQVGLLERHAQRLKELQVGWVRARASVFLSASQRKLLEEAEALDAKFVAGGRWACRDDAEALAELDRIAAGSGLEDTLQDLRDELVFWRAHPAALKCTDITPKDLKRAEQLIAALASVAEKEEGDVDAATALSLRNRCFWAADRLAKTFREGGRYVFREHPAIAAKFSSRYRLEVVRRQRRRNALRAQSDGAGGGSTVDAGPAAPSGG